MNKDHIDKEKEHEQTLRELHSYLDKREKERQEKEKSKSEKKDSFLFGSSDIFMDSNCHIVFRSIYNNRL